MNLPKIQEHNTLIQAVDAKELYNALGLDSSNWSRWHMGNIANNPFAIEYSDYVGFVIMTNGNQTANYMLSLDFAKKLAMQVRTQKGEEVRDYFLACERKAMQTAIALPDFTNPAEAARAWANEFEAKQQAVAQLNHAKPKIEHYDRVVERQNLLNATQVGQKLGLSGIALNKLLDQLGVYNKTVKRSRVFQQWFIDKGLGIVKQTDLGYTQALFTTRGEAWVIEKLTSEGVA